MSKVSLAIGTYLYIMSHCVIYLASIMMPALTLMDKMDIFIFLPYKCIRIQRMCNGLPVFETTMDLAEI